MSKLRFKNKKEFLDQYENEAKEYDSHRLITFEDKKVLREQLKVLSKIINKNNSQDILEAGCGTGRILVPLVEKGFHIEGFDLSKNMLKELRKKNNKIKIKVGDIESIPYKDNSFDLVYSITVLIHMLDFKDGFNDMYRVVKKNGLVVFDLPNRNSIWTRLSLFFNPNKKRTRLYTKKEIKESLKDYDYQITGIFSYARTFYKIPILRVIVNFLDNYLKLPVNQRTQFIVIVRKN